ncbi:hypothetical protein GCM10010219_40470 [Streptomyces netropsis]|nr:hypothetical protein GCM10010219_40470 [Streptomyces netropsis]
MLGRLPDIAAAFHACPLARVRKRPEGMDAVRPAAGERTGVRSTPRPGPAIWAPRFTLCRKPGLRDTLAQSGLEFWKGLLMPRGSPQTTASTTSHAVRPAGPVR